MATKSVDIKLKGATDGTMDAAFAIDLQRIVDDLIEAGYEGVTTASVLTHWLGMTILETNTDIESRSSLVNITNATKSVYLSTDDKKKIIVPRPIVGAAGNVFSGFENMVTFPIGYSLRNASITNPFSNCNKLRHVPLIDCTNSTIVASPNIFGSCQELRHIDGLIGWRNNLFLGNNTPNLTKLSALNIFNTMANISGGTAKTITLPASVFNELTDAEIAIATTKGFNVASA